MCLELVILLSFYRVCSTPLIESCVLQMLVYEFMPNGTLRDHLSGKWGSYMFKYLLLFFILP